MVRSAISGAFVWLVVVGVAVGGTSGLWLIEPLFLLAPLVLVPLALGLIDPDGSSWLGRPLQPWCALAAVAAFAVPQGSLAALLAAPWVAFTGLLALHGAQRLMRRGVTPASELAIDAGLAYVAVGGGWFLLSRLGVGVLGFEEPIVLLTAVHFHFAAFTALVLTGLAGRRLSTSRFYPLIVAGAIAGPALLAAGITLSPVLELAGAAILAVALGSLALVILTTVCPEMRSGSARGLLTVSALSVLVAMSLAFAYAAGRAFDAPLVALSFMARVHGTTNALGFGLCGLVGWTLARRAPAAEAR